MNDQGSASRGAAFPILPLWQLVATMVLFVANRMRMLSLRNMAQSAVPDEDQVGGVGFFAFTRTMAIFVADWTIWLLPRIELTRLKGKERSGGHG
jgi:hypothetical protein